MRVLLTGGGTAGHINPALAIAETVLENDPSAQIEFVGIERGKEADLIPREGYRLHFVESMGIRRSLSPANIKALWLALTSPYSHNTTRILDEFKPDIVIGTGGYACWPIMAAAARRGIPTAVHESNALPGLAIRRLQKKVDRVWINFERTATLLDRRANVLRVGNPLRRGFGEISYVQARKELGITPDRFFILSFGGSMGAEGVNEAVIGLMKDFSARNPQIIHVHAAGKRDYESMMKRFREEGLPQHDNCILTDYIYDMPLRMAAADLVISRAGAMTLSELSLMKKVSVLIPSPNVADNHQYLNAKTLADAGAAVLLEESTLKDGSLTATLEILVRDRSGRERMSEAVAAFADRNANRKIWEDIKMLVQKEKNRK